jgi:hypothetical protein
MKGQTKTQAVTDLVHQHLGSAGADELEQNLEALNDALAAICNQVMPLLKDSVRPLHVRGFAYILFAEQANSVVDGYLSLYPVRHRTPEPEQKQKKKGQ